MKLSLYWKVAITGICFGVFFSTGFACIDQRLLTLRNDTGTYLFTKVGNKCTCFAHTAFETENLAPGGYLSGHMKMDTNIRAGCGGTEKYLVVDFYFKHNGEHLAGYRYTTYTGCGEACDNPFSDV